MTTAPPYDPPVVREAEGCVNLTPVEAAALLRVTPKTLANWRSAGTGPAFKKIGGRVVYARGVVEHFASETGGGEQEGSKPRVQVSAPKYRNDPTRHHVSIMFEHPHTGETVRHRKVSAAGLSEDQAIEWGRQQGYMLWAELKVAGAKKEEPQRNTTQPTKAKPAQVHAPAPNTEGVPTLGEMWQLHAGTIKNPGSQRTRASEWRAVAPVCEGIAVNAWGPAENTALEAKLDLVGPGYANHLVTLVRKLFGRAVSGGWIDEIPKLPARRTVPEVELEDTHSLEDGDALLRCARELGQRRGDDLEMLLLLGLDAGLRPGESAGLRWKDVDLRQGLIHVRNQRPTGGVDRLPKMGKTRKVFLTSRLRAKLEAVQERATYVVTNAKGEPLDTDTVAHRVAIVHRAAGLGGPKRRGHHLRHCSASWLINGGGNLSQTQHHLGHARAATTERYIHRVKGTQPAKEAAGVLDRVHGNAVATHGNEGSKP